MHADRVQGGRAGLKIASATGEDATSAYRKRAAHEPWSHHAS